MLTEIDSRDGPAWCIVATRRDGSRYVLANAVTVAEAEALAQHFRDHGLAVERVDVEAYR